MTDTLFAGGWLSEFLDGEIHKMRESIEAGQWDDTIRAGQENAIKMLCDGHSPERITTEQNIERKPVIQKNMMRVVVHVPFTGEPLLFEYKPREFGEPVEGRIDFVDEETMSGVVRHNHIEMEIVGRIGECDFEHEFERWGLKLKQHVDSVNAEVDKFNRKLSQKIKPVVEARARLLGLADEAVASMRLPDGDAA